LVLREAVVTSARKLRTYSAAEIVRQTWALMCSGPAGLRQRDKLAFWYTRRADPRDERS
jgi:hypothetical protein